MPQFTRPQKHNQGSVLVIGMLTLILLSLIGVSATTTSRIEVEISGNDKAQKEAFFATELGLAVGENVVESLLNRIALNENATIGHYDEGTAPNWQALNWDHTDSVEVSAGSLPSGLQHVAASPRYIVEQRAFARDSLTMGIGIPTGIYYFNVSSHGTDSSGTGETLLQTIYAKRYD